MLKKSILICLSLILLLSLVGCNAGNFADDFSFSYIKPNNESIDRGDTLAITIGLTANKTYSWRGSFGGFIAYAHLVCGEGENAYKIYAEPIAFSEEVANYKVKKANQGVKHNILKFLMTRPMEPIVCTFHSKRATKHIVMFLH